MAWTNKGLYERNAIVFRGQTPPTNFYIALCTAANTPTRETNTLSQLSEIANGQGYTTGGYQLARDSTDFDTLTEDDANNRVINQIKNVVWTASGGPIPASGNAARWAVMTDDNVTVGSRKVWMYWDLGGDKTVTDGNPLTLQDLTFRDNASA